MFDGYYHYHNNRDYEQALQSLQEAEKYNPTEVPSDLFAWIWRRQGKHLEAIEAAGEVLLPRIVGNGNERVSAEAR